MSAATPDHIVRAIWNDARGINPRGPVMTKSDARETILDLDGWFTYRGSVVDISSRSAGAGLVELRGSFRGATA